MRNKTNSRGSLCLTTGVEEYKDDSEIIPRSSQVIAKRVPAARPGKGKGAMYISGTGPVGGSGADTSAMKDVQQMGGPMRARIGLGSMSKRFDGKEDTPKPQSTVSDWDIIDQTFAKSSE